MSALHVYSPLERRIDALICIGNAGLIVERGGDEHSSDGVPGDGNGHRGWNSICKRHCKSDVTGRQTGCYRAASPCWIAVDDHILDGLFEGRGGCSGARIIGSQGRISRAIAYRVLEQVVLIESVSE